MRVASLFVLLAWLVLGAAAGRGLRHLKYGVTFRVMHGHGSATALHAAAEDSWRSEKPMVAEPGQPARLRALGAERAVPLSHYRFRRWVTRGSIL